MTRLKRLLPIIGFASVILYFTYHTLTGEQGMRNLLVYKQREVVLAQRLAHLQKCRAGVEERIQLLSDNSLDLDYLEERAHAVLFLADRKDIVLTYKTGTNTEAVNSAALPCTY